MKYSFLRRLAVTAAVFAATVAGSLLLSQPQTVSAAGITSFGCTPIGYSGADVYSTTVNCWVQMYRPAGDTGADPLTFIADIPYSAARPWGYSLQTAGNFQCSAFYIQGGAVARLQCVNGHIPVGGYATIDWIMGVTGDCGTTVGFNGALYNPYAAVPAGSSITFPGCPPPPPPPPPPPVVVTPPPPPPPPVVVTPPPALPVADLTSAVSGPSQVPAARPQRTRSRPSTTVRIRHRS